jgi:hypothetical protein
MKSKITFHTILVRKNLKRYCIVREEDCMSNKTLQRISVVIILLFLVYIVGVVSKNYSLAYNRAEYEFVSFDFVSFQKTGDPQRRTKQLAERLEQVEQQLDKMGGEGWELHSFWGNGAIVER